MPIIMHWSVKLIQIIFSFYYANHNRYLFVGQLCALCSCITDLIALPKHYVDGYSVIDRYYNYYNQNVNYVYLTAADTHRSMYIQQYEHVCFVK